MDAERHVEQPEHIETLCAEIEPQPESVTRPLTMPIVTAAVFQVDSLETVDDLYEGRSQGYIYTRDANPNQTVLGDLVARLEGAEAGLAAASGMGAIAAAIMPGLKHGDRIVAGHDLYGRTMGMLRGPLSALGVETEFVDLTDTDAAEQALRQPAAVVIVESISNPLVRVPDLPALAELAHRAGARFVIDNTFASPYHCRPLQYGADVVVHSGTKYLGGHSDVTNGVLVGRDEFVRQARASLVTFGASASPFDCWLTCRGIKTLALRMRAASANAQAVCEFLSSCPGVEAVHYPGLRSHPHHARAKRLLTGGFSAMAAFDLRGGEAAASRFVRGLRRIKLAPSLADVSTTISHPAKTSHRSYTAEQREAIGIYPGLIRLSVGIEHPDDIIEDLRRGLMAAG
ncbi:MAG: trans-sulfuration enzyme family protein [Dehalococcoidia bacterium]